MNSYHNATTRRTYEARPIPTIHGYQTPTWDDLLYMNYLDEITADPDYGVTTFQVDPIVFRMARDEWLASDESVPS